MSTITSTRHIPQDAAKVFAAARQVERFPEVLPNIDRVTVTEDRGGGIVVSSWEGSFSLGTLKRALSWTEVDRWDEAALRCTFELLEGDMKTYSGAWTFAQNGTGCDVKLEVEFELGIPLLGPLVNRIVDNLMQQNCDELLVALEKLSCAE